MADASPVVLDDLFSLDDLAQAKADGLVVERTHPLWPYAILNYSDRCQYERGHWTPVTRQCRGLIYHQDTREVLARPFPKFFNHDQPEAPTLPRSTPVTVTDKLDGSLGILYRQPDGGHALATRGSFLSKQAVIGTSIWLHSHADTEVPADWTLLFEILYPLNRIVVDYGDRYALVLLGAVHRATGRSIGPDDPLLASWTGERAAVLPYATLAEAVAAPPRPNAEGVVIHVPATDDRIKVKYAEYVRLHRLVTGLNERRVWEHLADGGTVSDLLAVLPDELHPWTCTVAVQLRNRLDRRATHVETVFAAICRELPPGWLRKDFAARVRGHPDAALLFARLDGKPVQPLLWRELRPDDAQPCTWENPPDAAVA